VVYPTCGCPNRDGGVADPKPPGGGNDGIPRPCTDDPNESLKYRGYPGVGWTKDDDELEADNTDVDPTNGDK